MVHVVDGVSDTIKRGGKECAPKRNTVVTVLKNECGLKTKSKQKQEGNDEWLIRIRK